MDRRHVAAFRGKFRPRRYRAMLHKGEYVVNINTAGKFHEYIEAMNRAARRTSEQEDDA